MGDTIGLAEMAAKREIRPALQATGTGTAEMRPYRGQYAALDTGGIGTAEMAAKRNIRIGLTVSIGGALTQDDVTGAVLTAPIEGGYTLGQVLRLLLAQAAGSATGLEGLNPVFKSVDGSKDRIAATYASGTRTITSLDVS
jgi:hypothetical protein